MKLLTLIAVAKAVLALTDSCPANSPISCSSSTLAASCCFESPGGVLLATQFWDYSPPVGADNQWGLHGLWPDNCDGTYQQFCDKSLEFTQSVKSIVVDEFGDNELYKKMQTVWKNYNGDDESLWQHEYNKHGTCVNTLNPSCYTNPKQHQSVYDFFRIAVNAYEKLDTYSFLTQEGIVPSNTKTYTKAQIQAALNKHFGGNTVYFKCDSSNALNEVWYFHHVKGSVLGEAFLNIDSLNGSGKGCSSSGIKWIPKTGGSAGKTTVTTKTNDGGSSTGTPSKGFLRLDGKSGCLISNGKYYESGTCASYTVSKYSLGGYTVKSSKGYCGFDSNGDFNCASGNSASENQFSLDASTNTITYGNKQDFCLDTSLAQGSPPQTPIKVKTGSCTSYNLKFGN